MSITQLIAQGGGTENSPYRRFIEGRNAAQSERINEQTLQTNEQAIQANKAKMQEYQRAAPSRELAQQAQDIENETSIAKNKRAKEFMDLSNTLDWSKPDVIDDIKNGGFPEEAAKLEEIQMKRATDKASLTGSNLDNYDKSAAIVRSRIPYVENVQQYEQLRKSYPMLQLLPAQPEATPESLQNGLKFAVGDKKPDKTGSSEFERLEYKKQTSQLSETEQSRHDYLAGTGMKIGEEERLNVSREKMVAQKTEKLRAEATASLDYTVDMSKNIDMAFAAMDSGDEGMADQILSQVASQVADPNTRAYAMYSDFNQSYGDVVSRISSSIQQFVTGGRPESQKEIIRATLKNFQESYTKPNINRIKQTYRENALAEGINPFSVVPPAEGMKGADEIRDTPGLTKEQKLKYLKQYKPYLFTGYSK